MAQNFTKREMEELLNAQTKTILDAVNYKFVSVDERFAKIEKEMSEIRKSINNLANTLDAFLGRLTNYETEFAILRTRMDKMTAFIKDRFGVEITAQ